MRPSLLSAASAPTVEVRTEPRRSLRSFWQPRYWPAWCAMAWLRAWAALPLAWSLCVHRLHGRAMYSLAPRQRHVVRRNLEICFPRLTARERERLVKRHFESVGMSLGECAFAWFASDHRIRGRFTVLGLEHVTEALAKGHGVILYTGHFTALEPCGRPLRLALPNFTVLFSHRGNALLDEMQRRGRLRVAHEAVPSDNVRALLRALKRNAAVWYAPDQMHSLGELVPFFGEPAMTSLATSKLARLSGAPVIPFSYRRCDKRGHYALEFHAPLHGLPTADALAGHASSRAPARGFHPRGARAVPVVAPAIQGSPRGVARSLSHRVVCAAPASRRAVARQPIVPQRANAQCLLAKSLPIPSDTMTRNSDSR